MVTPVPQEDQERVRRLVEKIPGLPTLPAMLSTINKMVLNPRTSAKEIAQVISTDPVLTSKVLQVVNSPFYGFPNRITTVTHAIVILGFNTMKSIVLSSTIFDLFRKEARTGGLDRAEFWKHSIACGSAAKTLGRKLGYAALEEIFIAGLLHDIGKLVLDQFLHDKFSAALDAARLRHILIVEAEQEVLGVTHAEVGAWLFEKWSLTKGLVETTRCHHNTALARESQKLAEIIHVADILARAIRFGNGGDARIPVLIEGAWKSLALSENSFDDLLRETGEEIDKSTVFLDFVH
jgi:putative nucleotidyltransferase with HDIG domain